MYCFIILILKFQAKHCITGVIYDIFLLLDPWFMVHGTFCAALLYCISKKSCRFFYSNCAFVLCQLDFANFPAKNYTIPIFLVSVLCQLDFVNYPAKNKVHFFTSRRLARGFGSTEYSAQQYCTVYLRSFVLF